MGNEDVTTASVSTTSTNVPTASTNVGVASINQDTACAYIASQSSALLSMRADRFWKKTGKKISIQGSDVAGFDKSKVEYFNCHKIGHFARECRAPRSQDRGRRDNYRQGSKVEEQALKALMEIGRVGWDWSYMANDEENHALKNTDSLNSKITDLTDRLFDANNMIYHYKLGLAQVESRLVEHREREIKYCEKIRGLELDVEFKTNSLECLVKKLETLKKEKERLDGKLAGFQTASKDLDSLLESQRLDKNKEGLGYSAVPPPPAQLYSSPKKDLSWTGLPEFKDDTVTDYSRPAPTVESSPDDAQNKNPSVSKTKASPTAISPKSFIKFVKANDSQSNSMTDKAKTAKKPHVKKGMKQGTSRSHNNTHKSFTPRPNVHKPYRPPMRPMRSNMNGARPNKTSFNKPAHSYTNRPFQRTSTVRSQYRASWVPTVNKNFPPVNRNFSTGSSQNNIDEKGYWDSGCSRHMTGNISYLYDYKPFDGRYMSFGQGGCKITGKGTIKTGKVEFKNVYFVKDLKTPRQHNIYSIDLNNIVPHKDLTCLVAKASADECMLWHRRL
nr:hypothetical protein [Tanacetum cinerariifolium]